MPDPIFMSTPDPDDLRGRAKVLLANIHQEMAGRPGVQLRVPEQQARMGTEALALAVLALDETLNRIFPAEQPEVAVAETRPSPINRRNSRISVEVGTDYEELAARVIADPEEYAAKPEDQLAESVIAEMISATRPIAARAGVTHAMATIITGTGADTSIQEVAMRFDADGHVTTLHVDPTPDPLLSQPDG